MSGFAEWIAVGANLATLVALAGVFFQLKWQYEAARRHNETQGLILLSQLLLTEEERAERQIKGIKGAGGNYVALTHKVNHKIRPLKKQVDAALVHNLVADVPSSIDYRLIGAALKFDDA